MDTQDEDSGPENTSLADDLNAAWEADEGTQESDDGTTGQEKPTVSDGADGGIQAQESEGGSGGDSGESDGGRPADDSGVSESEEARKVAETDPAGAGAPVSWNATARETWKDIPKEAQAYIAQREQEMEQGIQKYAKDSQRATAMDQVLQPYSQYFAMNGGAGPTLKNLLSRGATLQMGAPAQKAQMIADMIQQYGVDIVDLDNLLVGKPVAPGTQQASEVREAVATAMQPFQQYLNHQNQAVLDGQQRAQGQVRTEVDTFAADPKNEFYRDVSNDMADILDMAANRNMEMSMAQAYERACSLNPEVSKILTNRTAAANAANKRRAGTSISGSPGGDGGPAVAGSMREALEQAWDASGQAV